MPRAPAAPPPPLTAHYRPHLPSIHLSLFSLSTFPGPDTVTAMAPAPTPMTTLVLIRHGESEANLREDTHLAGRYVGVGAGGCARRSRGGELG